MALLSTVYCTEAEIERLLSSYAVTMWSDHDQDGVRDTDVVNDCINQATEEIDLYCRQQYTQAQLETSELVKRFCVTMAARFLTQRRGDPVPDSLEMEFNRIADSTSGFLALIASGVRQLPGIEKRTDMRPTWSNLTVDRRYRRSTVRVTETNSSNAPTTLSRDRKVEYHTTWD